ncbi:hypothetical protein [Vibrio owensii]|uniref:hypothetical protein n=1 Tax=Vibrio owensii TaxID=696485 RepID=UPI00221EDFA7|nr:hypothetical protein [Vibrio owensii]
MIPILMGVILFTLAVGMYMGLVVDMRQYNMVIMWITLSTVDFTINTAITVTITDRLSWFMRNISK